MARCHGFIFCIYLQSIFFTYGFLIFPRGWCLRHHETRLHLAAFFLKPFILLDLSAQWATELRLKEIHCQPPWGQRQDHACSWQGHRSILAPQLETIQLHFVDFAHFFDLPIFTCHISDWGESTSSTQAEAMLWNCWKVWELVICLSFPKTCSIHYLCVVVFAVFAPWHWSVWSCSPFCQGSSCGRWWERGKWGCRLMIRC